MQYRVQSSVTEERLVRPTPQEPPKSYTPLNALSCMLPPGNESGEWNILQFSHKFHTYIPPHHIHRNVFNWIIESN